MGKRREARERAVQFLFQHDLSPVEDLPAALERFWESQRAAAIAREKAVATWGQPLELPPPTADEVAIREFADPLIRGTLENRGLIWTEAAGATFYNYGPTTHYGTLRADTGARLQMDSVTAKDGSAFAGDGIVAVTQGLTVQGRVTKCVGLLVVL